MGGSGNICFGGGGAGWTLIGKDATKNQGGNSIAGGGSGYGMSSSIGGGGGGGGGISHSYLSVGGYGIYNEGFLNILRNSQGGKNYIYGPLFYSGYAPVSYIISIKSSDRYGQLWCTGGRPTYKQKGLESIGIVILGIELLDDYEPSTTEKTILPCVFKTVKDSEISKQIYSLKNDIYQPDSTYTYNFELELNTIDAEEGYDQYDLIITPI